MIFLKTLLSQFLKYLADNLATFFRKVVAIKIRHSEINKEEQENVEFAERAQTEEEREQMADNYFERRSNL